MTPDDWRTLGEAAAVALMAAGTFFAKRAEQHARASRAQVENHHATNLRDDVDALRADINALRVTGADQYDRARERADAAHLALWAAIQGEPTEPPPTGPINTKGTQ